MKPHSRFQEVAIIREAECIGCAKCLQACPVDAILGSAKHMHTVIADECISCRLCIPVCPVDCIEMQTTRPTDYPTEALMENARSRIKTRKKRLAKQVLITEQPIVTTELDRKTYIDIAIQRARAKK